MARPEIAAIVEPHAAQAVAMYYSWYYTLRSCAYVHRPLLVLRPRAEPHACLPRLLLPDRTSAMKLWSRDTKYVNSEYTHVYKHISSRSFLLLCRLLFAVCMAELARTALCSCIHPSILRQHHIKGVHHSRKTCSHVMKLRFWWSLADVSSRVHGRMLMSFPSMSAWNTLQLGDR